MKKQQTYKIAVGMSGGVDSTATAYLLQQQGHEVFGLTMYLFDVMDSDGRLTQPAFIADAKKMCEILHIEHRVIDLRDPFRRAIMESFKLDYLKGITPNPCVKCNKLIKYGLLLEAAMAMGADKMATGHYARVVYDETADQYRLMTGLTHRKDQSYFLHQLSQEALSKLILPLGHYATKEEVRQIASQFNHYISSKKDSQGICFVDQSDFSQAIALSLPPGFGHGNIVTEDGSIVGQHQGYYKFTVGQKRGLHYDGPSKWTVIQVVPETSQIIVGEDSSCYATRLMAINVNWTSGEPLTETKHVHVKICQWGYLLEALVQPGDSQDSVVVIFNEPVRAIAPGQYCVFYDSEEVLGGGMIDFSFQ